MGTQSTPGNRTKVIAHPRRLDRDHARILQSRFGGENVFLTKTFDDAARLAKAAAREGYREILVIGGDGFFSKAVNGYLEGNADPKKLAFGLIPLGSGNDFARSFDIPLHFEKSLDHFQNSKAHPIDVCRIKYLGLNGERQKGYFMNAAGLGCIPMVAQDFNQLRYFRHPIMYSVLGFVDSYRYDSAHVTVSSGKKQLFTGPIRWISVTNGKYAGGGLRFGQNRYADDGLFQVKIAHSLPKWKTTLLCLRFATVGIDRHPHMIDHFLEEAKLTTPETSPVLVEADGEVIGKLPAEVSILPGHLMFHGRA